MWWRLWRLWRFELRTVARVTTLFLWSSLSSIHHHSSIIIHTSIPHLSLYTRSSLCLSLYILSFIYRSYNNSHRYHYTPHHQSHHSHHHDIMPMPISPQHQHQQHQILRKSWALCERSRIEHKQHHMYISWVQCDKRSISYITCVHHNTIRYKRWCRVYGTKTKLRIHHITERVSKFEIARSSVSRSRKTSHKQLIK